MYQYETQQLPQPEQAYATGVQPQQQAMGGVTQPARTGIATQGSTVAEPQPTARAGEGTRQQPVQPQGPAQSQGVAQSQQVAQQRGVAQPQQTAHQQGVAQPQPTVRSQQAVPPMQRTVQPQLVTATAAQPPAQSVGTVAGGQQLPATAGQFATSVGAVSGAAQGAAPLQRVPASVQQVPQSVQQVPASFGASSMTAQGVPAGAQQVPLSTQQLPATAQSTRLETGVGTQFGTGVRQQLGSGIGEQFGTGVGTQFGSGVGQQFASGIGTQLGTVAQGSELGGTPAQGPTRADWLRSVPVAAGQAPAALGIGSQQQLGAAFRGAAGAPTTGSPVGQRGLVGQGSPTLGYQGSAFGTPASTHGQRAAGGQLGAGAAQGGSAVAQQGSVAGQQGMSNQFGPQELGKTAKRRRQYLTGMPNVDVFETPDTVTIYADVPGSKDDDLEILANDNSITLLAKREEEEIDDDADLVLQERPTEFKRSITLPAVADIDAAEATHEDGICKISLPKREEARQKRIGFQ